MRLDLLFVTARALVDGYQFSPVHIKLLCPVHHPFVMSMATKRIAFVLLLWGWFTKGNDLGHVWAAGR
jgi:hypothetical protein